jgi:hypothetical protein
MKFELATGVPSKESESSDFYVDFSLKLVSALKEKVQEHNSASLKKVSLNQVIEKYCSAAVDYIKNDSIDINTYSMAKVNEFLEGRKGDFNVNNAEKDIKKFDIQFDFKNIDNLYLFHSKEKQNKWYEI